MRIHFSNLSDVIFVYICSMVKKLQIAFSYLALLIILVHGAVPHHHHEPVVEADCVELVHPGVSHHCDLSAQSSESDGELVCHFNVLSNKLSISSIFLSPDQTVFHSFCTYEKIKFRVYPSRIPHTNFYQHPSLRAPPARA